MNAETFSRYLQDRSLLHQLPYEELKTMAMQYPFCQPLQLLLLRKSLQDRREDWDAVLARVAATTSDRSLLYAEVEAYLETAPEEEVFQLSEDYLELSSLEEEPAEALELSDLDIHPEPSESALELDFGFGADAPGEADHSPESDTPTAGVGEELDLSRVDVPAGAETDIEAWKKQELEALESSLDEVTPDITAHPGLEEHSKASTEESVNAETPALPFQHAIATAIAVAGLLKPMAQPAPKEAPAADRMAPHEPLHAPKPSPRPKSSFSSWVAQFQPPDIQTQLSEIMESKKMEDIRRTRKKKKKGHPTSKVDEIVLQSITENGNLVSETLAKVLAQQGQYEKAEEMYRRLMLVFPEKSDYFAQQILNIKSD